MPSTVDNNSISTIEVTLDHVSYYFDVYNTPLGDRFLKALDDNLTSQRVLEKNFCFLGFADTKRNLSHLCKELNKSVEQINSFNFEPPYENIHPFSADDFQYSSKLKLGVSPMGEEKETPGLRLKHETCNLLHRYFEELQGTAWKLSNYYKQADTKTKYAIRQLNNLCHEIESWVISYRKKILEPEWVRPSQITTFLNAPRYDLHEEDFELFKQNRYNRELGGVYLHWSQVGKTLFEVFRDEQAPKMTDALCSEINHQKFYSGEFDVEWGQTINENTFDWKKDEMDQYRTWLKENNYDWENSKLSLGYIKLGQIDLARSFGEEANFNEIYQTMSQNLNIKKIKNITSGVECEYTYSIDDDDWRQIQIEALEK